MRALVESLGSNMSLVELHLGRVLVQGLTFDQVCCLSQNETNSYG